MNKNALVIGASSGIGLAILKKLSSSGYDIVAIHRDRRQQVNDFQREIDEIRDKFNIKINAFNMDATNSDKVTSFIEEEVTQEFSVVVHAVSRGNLKPFVADANVSVLSDQDLALTMEAMGTNLYTWVSKLLAGKMIVKGTRIITLTSEGNKRYWKSYGAVAMAKSALETMSKYLAVELAPLGITVNIIQAGVTDTPSLNMIPEVDNLKIETINRNPSKKLTTTEDVANAVYLFTLPEANWINGSLIHVDGGEHLI